MGDTAPPQAAGLAAGLLGGGPAAPRVHSAIVERLRARIAVCRQHHLSCEGRYERGRAESSDRERESTLQLLHLVQQGQGARKAAKHPKAAAGTAGGGGGGGAAPAAAAAAAAPPDYHQHLLSNGGINGEQSAGEQRASALLAVSHSAPYRREAALGGPPDPEPPPALGRGAKVGPGVPRSVRRGARGLGLEKGVPRSRSWDCGGCSPALGARGTPSSSTPRECCETVV